MVVAGNVSLPVHWGRGQWLAIERMGAGGAAAGAASAEGERGGRGRRAPVWRRSVRVAPNSVQCSAEQWQHQQWKVESGVSHCRNALVYLVWTSIRPTAFSNCPSSNKPVETFLPVQVREGSVELCCAESLYEREILILPITQKTTDTACHLATCGTRWRMRHAESDRGDARSDARASNRIETKRDAKGDNPSSCRVGWW